MADVNVRPPQAKDEAAWLSLWAGFQQHFDGAVPDSVTADTWQVLQIEGSALKGLLAETGGLVCGLVHFSFTPFAWTASPVCFLQDLFVSEDARGSGAGRALVQGVYDVAEAQGASNVFWLSAASDEPLRQFYRQIAVETPYVRFMQKPWAW